MRLVRLVTAALLSAVAVLPAHAQVKASSVPISRDVVSLRLVVGETQATLAVQNGGLARVSVKGGPTLGLIPVIGPRGVGLGVFEVVVDPTTGNEGIRQLTKSALTRGVAVQLDRLPLPLQVELVSTRAGRQPGPGPMGCITCCVVCGDYTVCGCEVEMECGTCCCASACICPPDAPGCASRAAKPGGMAGRR